MKKFMAIGLAALMAFSIVGCSKKGDQTNIGDAEEELISNEEMIHGNLEYGVNESGNFEITDFAYAGAEKVDVVIPAKIDGRPVTGIAADAFKSATLMKSVTFEEGSNIEYIGAFAFYGCELLTTVTLPNTVKTLGEGAFWGCTALETVNLPSALETVGNYAFWSCKALKGVTLPERELTLDADTEEMVGYITVGEGAFFDCDALSEVVLPKNTKSVGKGAFVYCDGLTKVTFKSADTELGEGVFAGSDNVKISAPAESKAATYAAAEKIELIPAQ